LQPLRRDRVKRLAARIESRLLSGEGLPAAHRDVDVERIDLDRKTGAPDRFGCDQRGAAAEEGLVYGISSLTVVEHRPAHTFDRLLCAVDCVSVLPAARDRPKRCLLCGHPSNGPWCVRRTSRVHVASDNHRGR
jgi:hypothetical protein